MRKRERKREGEGEGWRMCEKDPILRKKLGSISPTFYTQLLPR